MTNTPFTSVKGSFFHDHIQLHASNSTFLGCLEESCDIALESDLPPSVTVRDFVPSCLLRDHDTSYGKTSFVIKILLATQKSIKPSYLVSLNASQTEFNGASTFGQTCFRLYPLCLTAPLKNTKRVLKNYCN